MGRISTAFWKAEAINCAYCTRGKPISLRNNEDYERKRTN
jgi:aerobic-type carbon monoxide dehydrogenase small subunit (CoxS/CutS family)